MFIGSLSIELFLPHSHSLKEKRSVVKSVLNRLRNEFNISIAEVGQQDRWQIAQIGVVCVSSDGSYAEGQLNAVIEWIYEHRPDLQINYADIEIL